jgi:hypothetical protein
MGWASIDLNGIAGTGPPLFDSRSSVSLRKVFEPISINRLEISNHIVRSGHGTRFSQEHVTDQLIAYHVARA